MLPSINKVFVCLFVSPVHPDSPVGKTDSLVGTTDAPVGTTDTPAGTTDPPMGKTDSTVDTTDSPVVHLFVRLTHLFQRLTHLLVRLTHLLIRRTHLLVWLTCLLKRKMDPFVQSNWSNFVWYFQMFCNLLKSVVRLQPHFRTTACSGFYRNGPSSAFIFSSLNTEGMATKPEFC